MQLKKKEKKDPYDWFCGPGSHIYINVQLMHVQLISSHCKSKRQNITKFIKIFVSLLLQIIMKKMLPYFTFYKLIYYLITYFLLLTY